MINFLMDGWQRNIHHAHFLFEIRLFNCAGFVVFVLFFASLLSDRFWNGTTKEKPSLLNFRFWMDLLNYVWYFLDTLKAALISYFERQDSGKNTKILFVYLFILDHLIFFFWSGTANSLWTNYRRPTFAR